MEHPQQILSFEERQGSNGINLKENIRGRTFQLKRDKIRVDVYQAYKGAIGRLLLPWYVHGLPLAITENEMVLRSPFHLLFHYREVACWISRELP